MIKYIIIGVIGLCVASGGIYYQSSKSKIIQEPNEQPRKIMHTCVTEIDQGLRTFNLKPGPLIAFKHYEALVTLIVNEDLRLDFTYENCTEETGAAIVAYVSTEAKRKVERAKNDIIDQHKR